MRLENHAVAAFEAWMADDASAEQASPAEPRELPPAPGTEVPSMVLSDMARLPPPTVPVAAPMAMPAPAPVGAPASDPEAAFPVADTGAADRSGDAALIAHQDDYVARMAQVAARWHEEEQQAQAAAQKDSPRPSDGTNEYARDMATAAVVVSPDLPIEEVGPAAPGGEDGQEPSSPPTPHVESAVAPGGARAPEAAPVATPASSGQARDLESAAADTVKEDVRAAGNSIYPDRYRPVAGLPGVMPVGGYEALQLARDVPTLALEHTPVTLDGRVGAGVPYRDDDGHIFYRTFDADGNEVGWVSSPIEVAQLAPVHVTGRRDAAADDAPPDIHVNSATPGMAGAVGVTALGLSDAQRLAQLNAWLMAQGRTAVAGLAEASTAVGDVLSAGARAVITAAEAAEVASLAGLVAVAGAVNLLLIPPSRDQVTPLGDGQRFMARPGDVYGTLQQLDEAGQWRDIRSGVRLVLLGGERRALSDDEIKNLTQPLSQPSAPDPGPRHTGNTAPVPDLGPNHTGAPAPELRGPTVLDQPVQEPHWTDYVLTKDGERVYVPSRTEPSGQAGGRAAGAETPNKPGVFADAKLDTAAENKALTDMANAGYVTERNPTLSADERQAQGISATANPDARIEGKVFDVKASKSAQGAQSAIQDAVEKGQARRFIISTDNFQDADANARELASRLRANPIEGLQEVKVIVHGVVRNIYP